MSTSDEPPVALPPPEVKRPLHVRILNRVWAVVREGCAEPLSLHDRKIDAIVEAQALAAVEDAELVVFNLDGRRAQSDPSSPADG